MGENIKELTREMIFVKISAFITVMMLAFFVMDIFYSKEAEAMSLWIISILGAILLVSMIEIQTRKREISAVRIRRV